MEKSREFSASTQERLNNAPFDELDAAERRLSMAGWNAFSDYLKSRMTQEQRDVIAYCEQHSAAVIAAAVREVRA